MPALAAGVPLTATKPSMRGLLHVVAALASIATGVTQVVVAASVSTAAAAWSTAVYSVALLSLFSVSGLYNRRSWSNKGQAVMKRLDHSMIFVLIAGTYTPIAVLALPRGTSTVVLAVVWSGAALGVAVKLLRPAAPRWLGVALYLVLGWTAVAVFPDIVRGAGVAALVLIIVGGLAYTLGSIAYATRRPDPLPAVFGFHEVFHACTIVAATCHYIAIWLILF